MRTVDHRGHKRTYPLDGIRVLDLSTQVPGPYCSMLLADLGAEVIRIENIHNGDQTRLLPYLFNALNRNKKSIALNLKTKEAGEIFCKMSKEADVILEGFRPGVCKKLGIDYDTIKAINHRIIFCSISGYGQDGPYRDLPGHDINYLGYAGILSLEGDLNHYSNIQPLPLADLAGSMFAAVSILAALMNRSKTGTGQSIDVSMTDAAFSLAGASLIAGLQGQKGSELLNIPHYGIFKTKDGKHLTLGIVHEDHFWKNLCSVMDMGEMADLDLWSRIVRKEEIAAALRHAFITRDLHEWIALLHRADVPCGPVYNIEESYSDPQMTYRQSVFEFDHPPEGKVKFRAFPARFSESLTRKDLPPPAPGMHTSEILRRLGYTEMEIAGMIEGKIVG